MVIPNATKIKSMCKNLNFPEGKLSEEFLFTIEMADLFYYKGNIGEVDIKTRYTDGTGDGGIDFICTDNDKVSLLQGKSGENLTLDDIKHLFNKMKDTVTAFEHKKYDSYSSILKSAYINAVDSMPSDYSIELVLFSTNEISEDIRNAVYSYAENDLSDFYVIIYDRNEIEAKSVDINYDLIQYGDLNLYLNADKKNNVLSYGENGAIVNIMASSLKRLYVKDVKNGLFNYNLREHINQKNVDEGIDETIKKEREKFWYFNNGITIGCKDFKIDGSKLKLYDFSIINGAQTTTKIGKSKIIDEEHDFSVVCKIVKASKLDSADSDFINQIAEKSNSQKPIKFRDLKSNAKEQRILQKNSANNKYPLSIEIKRGVIPDNSKKVDKWQRITNEYLGQLVLACLFQCPGTARTEKNKIFSNTITYNKIFRRKDIDYNTLYDLVRLSSIYDEFATEFISKCSDMDYIAVVNNAKLSILAICVFLIKKQKRIISNSKDTHLKDDNLTGLLITDYPKDDLNEKLYDLFEFLVRQINIIYHKKEVDLKLTSYSNFLKSDSNYELILSFIEELDKYDTEKLNSFLTVFSEKNN